MAIRKAPASKQIRYVVTGVPGWLGNRLLRILKEGHPDVAGLGGLHRDERVRCLVLPGQSGLLPADLRGVLDVVEGDITDPEALDRLLAGVTNPTLFHLAGIVHPRRTREFYDVHVQGTRNLIERMLRAGARRILAVSSNSPTGCNPEPTQIFDELESYHPYMHYGRSKMQMEELLFAAQAQGALDVTVLRPCWFYGPEQPARQTRFFSMVRRGRAPIVDGGQNLRSMSYVDNVVAALLLAAPNPVAKGRLYWVANPTPYPMHQIVDTVERLLEHEFKLPVHGGRLRIPKLLCTAAQFADALVQATGHYIQDIHVLSEMDKTIACSTARAEHELGHRATVTLEEGMRRSIAWCLRQGLAI